MNALFDLVRVISPTTGTGPTIALGPAVASYRTFSQAGVPDNAVVSYGISDGPHSECGSGAYDADTQTLTRNVFHSTGPGFNTPINLSGTAEIYVTAIAADFDSLVAPEDGRQYARVGDSWQVVDIGTTVNSSRYRFNTNPSPPPASGNVRFNHAEAAHTTIAYIHEVNMDSTNLGNLFGLVTSDARLFIQDKDTTTRYHVFNLTGLPVDQGNYFDFPVAYVRGAGGEFTSGELLNVSIIGGGGSRAELYTIGFSFVGGVLGNGQLLGLHKFTRPVSFVENFVGSAAGGTANATASTVITISKALAATPNTFSTIGSITFAAGTINPTFATTGGAAQTCAAGDVLRLTGPATADATFANFYATLVGS